MDTHDTTIHDHIHSLDGKKTFEVKIKNKKEVAEGTMAFIFEKPEGFTFKAGQHIEIILINPPETDEQGNKRTFSLVNSPTENDIMIATRIRDTAFKRVLKNMELGTPVRLEGPFGSFTLDNDTSKAAVFLMGGIGITPAMSIIKDAVERKLPHLIFLFYSNRRLEDATFFDELQKLSDENLNFTFIPTMTESEKFSREWSGEKGFINQEMISRYIKDKQSAIYYLAGPPAMVGAMRKLLTDEAVNEDNIRMEEFAGY